MADRFPELTSFGTIFIFAGDLEATAEELAAAALERPDCAAAPGVADALRRCVKKHGKRGRELERLRRERLNEVVLQPLSGMNRADYLPPTALPTGPAVAAAADALATVAAVDQILARFYDAAAAAGAHVLGGMDRTFRKLAAESRELAAALRVP